MNTSTSSSSSPEPLQSHWLPLPRRYRLLKILGDGGYGTVVKCARRGSAEAVAVKIPRQYADFSQEASMMRVLMGHNLDKFNIIKFHEHFYMNSRMNLVFEVLDISLQDYLLELEGPMRLGDIRTVIQQMATAFDALKRVGVIHTDVKIDNIMMVDHLRQPFRVKLIDFGLAIFRSEAKPNMVHQTPPYRAPEITLGLPLSEAIDIWSLGCVMAIMIFGFMLFPARMDYDALRFNINLLGPPTDHLLNAGQKTKEFFKKTESDQWILMTPQEYWVSTNYSTDNRFYTFRSLDEPKTMRLERDNVTEADERRDCIELLKAMLKWDERERIIPSGILSHPFITQSYLHSISHLGSSNEPEPSTSKTQISTNQGIVTTQVEDSPIETLPSGVIMVQPAAPMNRIYLEEAPHEETEMSPHPAKAPATDVEVTSFHLDNTTLPTTTSDDSKDKKKKKYRKKIFCSCCYVDDIQE